MHELADRMHEANPDYCLDIRMIENTFHSTGDPFSPHAQARNYLLDQCLDGHDLVMWIDADLVDYPADIITQLDRANPGGVTAPMVLVEGTDQFYDTYGYRQNGRQVGHISPYFRPFGRLIDMDEVGCAYLIPACVYLDRRYETTPGHTEHASIMAAALDNDLKVACFTGMTIYHADLPLYGEQWHGH
jgi:glycosyltransferase involved in cell wall biosynthesis